jgi:hypothetical protein
MLLEFNVKELLPMSKYYNPEEVEKLCAELRQAKTDFFHLATCKLAHQPAGLDLDTILEDRYAKLAEICEEITFIIDDYFKNY